MQSIRELLLAAALSIVAAMMTIIPIHADAAGAKVQLMFVQSAEGLTADDKTLRLVNLSPQTIWFTDRPVRQAGHVTTQAYMTEWTAAAGPNNFSKDPPNSTLSVYQAGQRDNTLTVIEVSEPKVEGKDLVYRYKLIEGQMPKAGGAVSLFIDWIGPGGGVGPGFHGVGVGGRGVGWR
jgi:hypothetical protein